MQEIKNSFYTEKYYFDTMSIADIFRCVRYVQFKGEYKLGHLMKKNIYHTKQIDLTLSKEELKSSFSRTVKKSINKSEKDGITFNIYKLDSDEKIDFYIDYYNSFAKSKNLHFKLSRRQVIPFLKHTVVTFAKFDGEILSMYRYMLDNNSKTVYCIDGSSDYELVEKNSLIDRNFIGRANRFLHYQDMLYFKERGFTTYDLGGYGVDTQNYAILAINEFKDGFRGELIQENHYESYPFVFLKICYRAIKKIRDQS
jgi:lipid II:glycine glycyltransferase (peptidoglycan interpeptide bridge formation enzyme)